MPDPRKMNAAAARARARRAGAKKTGNRPEQNFETMSPQIGRHLSKLTGTGAKNRKAKIKGRGPVDARKRLLGMPYSKYGMHNSKGGSIRMPGGPANPETRSERHISHIWANPHLHEGGQPR
jgi:hypothetical protein